MDQEVSPTRQRGRRGRLTADEAARLPDRLLDAATAMFLEQGYGQTTMGRIAREAGASTKTVYGRYRNKKEILTAAVKRLMDRALPDLEAAFDLDADELEPRSFLIGAGERLATLASSPDALGIYRLTVAEAPRFPELARLYAGGSGRVVALLARLFERWHSTGRLPLYSEPEFAAQTFLDLVVATPRNKAVIGKPLGRAALRAHVAAAVDLFFRGCGPGA
jgi:TetR/AcrR family transcriptional regulator, mexJK operon transcriptional repressor